MARVAPINGITTEVQNDITLTEKALIKEPLSTTLGYFKQLSEHYEWLMGADSFACPCRLFRWSFCAIERPFATKQHCYSNRKGTERD